jgi:hypothetical protein
VTTETSLYTVRDRESELAVETWYDGRNRARLLVDGHVVDAADTSDVGRVELVSPAAHRVHVAWWWRARVAACMLVTEPSDEGRPAGERGRTVPFRPPPGLGRRWHDVRSRHPVLYAARHVVAAVGGVLVAVLGIGALVRALLPRVDWSWLPEIDVHVPEWLRYLDPWRYLEPVVSALFGWVPDLHLSRVGWLQYVVPVLVAVAVAAAEVRRSRARRRDAGALRPERPERSPDRPER